MSPSARCDEILRLIDQVLDGQAAGPDATDRTTGGSVTSTDLHVVVRERRGAADEMAPRPN